MTIGLYGVVFHGEDARNVQMHVTLQTNMKNQKKPRENLEEIRTGNFSGVEKCDDIKGQRIYVRMFTS